MDYKEMWDDLKKVVEIRLGAYERGYEEAKKRGDKRKAKTVADRKEGLLFAKWAMDDSEELHRSFDIVNAYLEGKKK